MNWLRDLVEERRPAFRESKLKIIFRQKKEKDRPGLVVNDRPKRMLEELKKTLKSLTTEKTNGRR